MAISLINGFLCTSALFFICLISVIGAKYLLNFVKSYLKPKEQPVETPPPQPKKRKSPKNIKRVKSIEIDASEVDKIFFKKSS